MHPFPRACLDFYKFQVLGFPSTLHRMRLMIHKNGMGKRRSTNLYMLKVKVKVLDLCPMH